MDEVNAEGITPQTSAYPIKESLCVYVFKKLSQQQENGNGRKNTLTVNGSFKIVDNSPLVADSRLHTVTSHRKLVTPNIKIA